MKRAFSLLIVVSMMLITSCGFVSEEKEITGTYKIEDGSMGDIDEMVFNEGGGLQIVTYYYYSIETEEDKQILSLKEMEDAEPSIQYVIVKSEEKYKLCLYFDGEQLEENAVNISLSDGTDGILGSNNFSGTYKDESNKVSYGFSKDGSMKMVANETYKISGEKLTFTGATGSTEYTFEEKDDGKEIEVSDDTGILFTLVK